MGGLEGGGITRISVEHFTAVICLSQGEKECMSAHKRLVRIAVLED